MKKYLFLTISLDGTGAITAAFTPVRIVCNNTLNMALRDYASKITFRHTRDARSRLETAHKVLGISNKLSQQLEDIINHCSNVRIGDLHARQLIRMVLAPARELSDNLQKISDSVFVYGQSSPTQQTNAS